jgi:ornithine carbamoyltransferase
MLGKQLVSGALAAAVSGAVQAAALTRIKVRAPGLARLCPTCKNAARRSVHSHPTMALTLEPRPIDTPVPMTAYDLSAVLAHALALQRAALAGATQEPLRGKHFGLWCDAGDDAVAALFDQAATGLGAQVAHVRPSLSARSTVLEVQHTARVLGRLYDAVECLGMAPALVAEVSRWAGVPVYDGLARADHPTARLADKLDLASPPTDRRRYVLQAVLLCSVA